MTYFANRTANITRKDENGNSPVQVAARVSTARIVELLLREDPKWYPIKYDTNRDGKTPLHIAAERDDPDIIKVKNY